jgi:glycosyltransferase involved in cell wall biosynthesis
MASELLTAVIPIGRKHISQNRISDWIHEANELSENLKLLLIEDTGDNDSHFPPSDGMYSGLKNFEIYRKELGGPGQARNFGLGRVQSPWVCFWDSDDLPKISQFFQNVLNSVDANSEVLIGDYAKVIGSNGTVRTSSGFNSDLRRVAVEPGIWRMAFQTKMIKELAFESVRMAEDQIFLLDLNLANRKILFSDDILYSYTTGGPNQLTSDIEAKQELSRAIDLVHVRIRLGKIQVNEFSTLILMKLNLTFLKSCSLRDKILAISSFIKSITIIGGYRRTAIFYLLKTFFLAGGGSR